MPTTDDLETLSRWLVETLRASDGRATIVDVCKHVSENHESQLRQKGNLFYTWQYDIRWIATRLRKKSVMRLARESSPGEWELTRSDQTID